MAYRPSYIGAHVVEALRASREEKGLSQRELSRLSGIPQSHISKIERGEVDLQVSSLIELARILDLEIMSLPRKFVPVVESIVRSKRTDISDRLENTRRVVGELQRTLNRLKRSWAGNKKDLEPLDRTTNELQRLPLSLNEFNQIRAIASRLRHLKSGHDATTELEQATRELQHIRNKLMHRGAEPVEKVRPAYSLDEEHEDA
jgi:transcriptional regulator with XRE-family HTH domain